MWEGVLKEDGRPLTGVGEVDRVEEERKEVQNRRKNVD